jgi:hypothetical protein
LLYQGIRQNAAAEVFSRQGFVMAKGVLPPAQCHEILLRLPAHLDESAGSRDLLSHAWCQALARSLRSTLGGLLERNSVAIQCTYFAKSHGRNWLVPLHQDLSVPVAERVAGDRLTGWSLKQGTLFVQPPTHLLEQLVAVRVHLDPCMEDDGPLRVIPASHSRGLLSQQDTVDMARTNPPVSCVASAGDALVMRPLLLHASSKASGTSLRRVLHFLFAPARPPYGLWWQLAI